MKILLIALLAFSLFLSINPAAVSSATTYSFNIDRSAITVNYNSKTYNLVRPVNPSDQFISTAINTFGGNIFWVSTSGSDSANGSESTPFRTISKGISMLQAGDILYVKAGTYTTFTVSNKHGTASDPIVISAAPGDTGEVLIVSSYFPSRDASITVTDASTYIWIQGFAVEGTKGKAGAATNDDYSANGITFNGGAGNGSRVFNNIVYGNLHCGIKEMGHGGVNILIEANVIFGNGTDGLDHGIYLPNTATADGNIVFGHSSYGIHLFSQPTGQIIKRNVVFENGSGALLLAGSNTQIYNNTFVSNANGVGIYYFREYCTDNILRNNIVAFNKTNAEFDDCGGACSPGPVRNDDDYSIFYGATTKPPHGIASLVNPFLGDHEVYSDPLFVDRANYNFQLQSASPAKNAGVNVGITYSGSAPEIGAYEVSEGVQACLGDYNSSGMVELSDFIIFGQNYKVANINCSLDLVGNDRYLNIDDFSFFAGKYRVENCGN